MKEALQKLYDEAAEAIANGEDEISIRAILASLMAEIKTLLSAS